MHLQSIRPNSTVTSSDAILPIFPNMAPVDRNQVATRSGKNEVVPVTSFCSS